MSAKRVLIVRVGAMGDVLHALPGVAALKRARPEWVVDWVVDPRWRPLLVNDAGEGPIVGRAYIAETKLWSRNPLAGTTRRSVLRLRRELRAPGFELAVDLQGTLRSSVIGKMARAHELAGYSDPRESAAAWMYSRRFARRGSHVVEMNVNLLSDACGVALQPADFALPLEPWAETWAEQEAVLTRPMCVLSPGGGWGAKQWPVERYGALARALRADGFDVVVNAPRADDAMANGVASGGAARVVVCNVSGLIALMRRADLMVGGDTGPMHLAAALAVPTIALFGPTSPERNGPWGPGATRVLRDASSVTSYKKVDAIDPGLARITVERVMEAVKELRG